MAEELIYTGARQWCSASGVLCLLLVLSLFKILLFCISWVFCINFSSIKYCIKILFILVTECFDIPLNFVSEVSASLISPKPHPDGHIEKMCPLDQHYSPIVYKIIFGTLATIRVDIQLMII